jgi:hypothetical protein
MNDDTRLRDDEMRGPLGDDPADKTQPAEGGLAEVIELPGGQGGDPSGTTGDSDETDEHERE